MVSKQSIPWTEPGAWRGIQDRIRREIRHGDKTMEYVRRRAWDVAAMIASLVPLMDELCAATCPWCPEPCCLGAKIWFDAKDLLLFHLTGRTPPPAQPIVSWQDRCRYAGPSGCRLDRVLRPWICTWYLCPTQKARLRCREPESWAHIEKRLGGIAEARKRLETEFSAAAGVNGQEFSVPVPKEASKFHRWNLEF